MRQKIRFLGVATTLLFLALAPAAHGATVFGVGGSLGSACNIFSIETSTGASTFLVDTGVTCALASGLTVTPNGLAYDFPSNRVYFSDIKAGGSSNLLFVDLDDAVPTPTCASGACDGGGDIAATIDNAAMFEGEYYYLNYAQIRRSHRRWSCGDSGTRVNSVISQVVFSAVSLPV